MVRRTESHRWVKNLTMDYGCYEDKRKEDKDRERIFRSLMAWAYTTSPCCYNCLIVISGLTCPPVTAQYKDIWTEHNMGKDPGKGRLV